MAQIFDCPFCGKTDACGVRMDFDHKIGAIFCDSCGAKYEMAINQLSEPIDVYSEWIDMCARCACPQAPRPLLLRVCVPMCVRAAGLSRSTGVTEAGSLSTATTMSQATSLKARPNLRWCVGVAA